MKKTIGILVATAVCLAVLRASVVLGQAGKARSAPTLAQRLPADLRRGLEAYYLFEAVKDGRAADAGAKNRAAAVHGATPAKAGRTGGALAFDGKDDHLAGPKLQLQALSFSAWVRTGLQTGSLNNRRLFFLDGGGRGCAIQCNTRGGIDVYLGRREVNDYTWRLGANEWTHVAATFDGKTVRIYRNGRLTRSAAVAAVRLTGAVHLGGPAKSGGAYWQGAMDSAAIHSRALSAGQVHRLYVWAFADVALAVMTPMTGADRAEVERLIRGLDADSYQTREKATEALRKQRSRFLPELVRRAADRKLSAEVRARIEQVLGGSGRDDLAAVMKLGLLRDPTFLVDLLEMADPARRGFVLAHLRAATGARLGADLASWRQWLKKHPPKAPEPHTPTAPPPDRMRDRTIRLLRRAAGP